MTRSHWVCKPALFVAIPSQDKLEGWGRKSIQHKNGAVGDDGGGAPIVWMAWHPDRLSVCLPLLYFPAPQNPEDGEQ